ncbi:transposase [Jeotgalicoccus nanhaiensis]
MSSFPRSGDVTAVQIIAEVGDIRRFNSSKQLSTFTGSF